MLLEDVDWQVPGVSIRNTAMNSSNVFGLLNRALSYVEQ